MPEEQGGRQQGDHGHAGGHPRLPEPRSTGRYPFTTDGVVIGVPDAGFEEEMQTKITFATAVDRPGHAPPREHAPVVGRQRLGGELQPDVLQGRAGDPRRVLVRSRAEGAGRRGRVDRGFRAEPGRQLQPATTPATDLIGPPPLPIRAVHAVLGLEYVHAAGHLPTSRCAGSSARRTSRSAAAIQRNYRQGAHRGAARVRIQSFLPSSTASVQRALSTSSPNGGTRPIRPVVERTGRRSQARGSTGAASTADGVAAIGNGGAAARPPHRDQDRLG